MAELFRIDFDGKKIVSREKLPDPEKVTETSPPDNFSTREEMERYFFSKCVLKGLRLDVLRAIPYYNNLRYQFFLASFIDPQVSDLGLINNFIKYDEGDWESDPERYRAFDDAIQQRIQSKSRPSA
jgi:hypothetical protein